MFDCEKCGSCCRNINNIFFVEGMALPNGCCKFLDEDTNLCTIYETRPLFCNVDAYYKKFFANVMTRKEFYAQNKKFCRLVQEKCDDKNFSLPQRRILSFNELPQFLKGK